MPKNEILEWVNAKKSEQAESAASGSGDYFSAKVGNNDITLLPIIPDEISRDFDDGPKDQYIFHIEVNGKEKLWTRTASGSFTTQLRDLLPFAPIAIKVFRVGTGRDSRYTLVKAPVKK